MNRFMNFISHWFVLASVRDLTNSSYISVFFCLMFAWISLFLVKIYGTAIPIAVAMAPMIATRIVVVSSASI